MIGMTLARQLTPLDVKDVLDFEIIAKAMKDSVDGKTDLSESEMHQVSTEFSAYLRARRQIKSEAAKKDGEEFLAKNAKAEGVKVLPDGLQYKVLAEGAGAHPKSNDIITVKYRGTLVDGTEFDAKDSSKISLTRVVPGWREAFPMMAVGSHWQLFLPAELGYAAQGKAPKILPNSALIFDVELLGAEAPPEPPAPLPGAMNSAQGTNQIVSGEIIKVPSAEGLKRGEKIEVIKPGETNTVPTPK